MKDVIEIILMSEMRSGISVRRQGVASGGGMRESPGGGVGRKERASERLVAWAEGRVAIGHWRLEAHSC